MNETPNKAMQPTAGRFDAPYKIMKTPPLEFTFAPFSGGLILFSLSDSDCGCQNAHSG